MNVVRALTTEGAKEHAVLREKIARLIAELADTRRELHTLEDLAQVAGVDLTLPPEEAAVLQRAG